MVMFKYLLIAFAIGSTIPAGPASGQYQLGDVLGIDTVFKPVFGITRQGKVYTVTTLLPQGRTGIFPAPDNRSVWVTANPWNVNLPGVTVKIQPDGTVTTMFRADLMAMDTDGGGNAIGLETRNYQTNILEISTFGITTLYSVTSMWAAGGAIDLASGDYITVGRDKVIRYALHGAPSVTTVLVTNTMQQSNEVHVNPDDGSLIGSAQIMMPWPVNPILYRLTLGNPGRITTLMSGTQMGMVQRLDWDPFDGRFVLPATAAGGVNVLYRYDARANLLTTQAVLSPSSTPTVRLYAATVAGSRHLWAGTEPWPGQPYRLMVSSPGEAGAAYMIGLSFGFHPGITLPDGRSIHLNPDPLLVASLTNAGIFKGFQGWLNHRGEGPATLEIPRQRLLSGVRFFAVAITLANQQIRTISEPLGVTIR